MQGSLLGPLLFIIFINDFSKVFTLFFLFSLMFKYSIGVLHSPVSALFKYNSVIHTHNTRRSKFIHNRMGRSEETYGIFFYLGAHYLEL